MFGVAVDTSTPPSIFVRSSPPCRSSSVVGCGMIATGSGGGADGVRVRGSGGGSVGVFVRAGSGIDTIGAAGTEIEGAVARGTAGGFANDGIAIGRAPDVRGPGPGIDTTTGRPGVGIGGGAPPRIVGLTGSAGARNAWVSRAGGAGSAGSSTSSMSSTSIDSLSGFFSSSSSEVARNASTRAASALTRSLLASPVAGSGAPSPAPSSSGGDPNAFKDHHLEREVSTPGDRHSEHLADGRWYKPGP